MAGSSPLTVVKLSPEDRTTYRSVLEKTILSDGVKVVIADKECGITHNRTVLKQERQTIKKHGYLPRKTHMNITPEVCEGCLECTKATACPGLTTIDTDYGRKIDTDLTWCVNDGACERVRTSNEAGTTVKPCPSFEQVTIVRKKRRRYTLPHMALDKLPEPTPIHKMDKAGDTWRAHLSRRRRHGHRRGQRHPRPRRPQGRLPRPVPGQEGPGHPQRRRLLADQLREGRGGARTTPPDVAGIVRRHSECQHSAFPPPPAPSPTARPTCCSASTSSKPPGRSTRGRSSASPRPSGPAPS